MPRFKQYSVLQPPAEIRNALAKNQITLNLTSEDEKTTVVSLRIRTVLYESDRLIIEGIDQDRLKTVNVHIPKEGNDGLFSPFALIIE